jgi:hypothetical protein
MQQDREADFSGLTESHVEIEQGRIFIRDGRRYIRVGPQDRFKDIAQEAYEDPNLWFLVYYHNRHFLAAQSAATREIILYLPPPPEERLRIVGDRMMIMVIPGDSFPGIASQVYGDANKWQVAYEANKMKIPDPSDPSFLFKDPPEALSKYFSLPRLKAGVPVPAVSRPAPQARVQPKTWRGVSDGATVASSSGPRPSGQEAAQAPVPESFRELRLTDASQVSRREAEIILKASGFYADRIYKKHSPPATSRYEAALAAVTWGNSYKKPRSRVTLDAKRKQWIFEQYQQLQEATRRYQGWSDISKKHRPKEYESWVVRASQELTNVPAGQRVALMKSLMTTESGKTHWRGYQPIVSHAGAVGFGQLMPATAKELGVNPYDPAQNIQGIAKLLNKNLAKAGKKGLRGRSALRQALAEYNGGGKPPRSSYRYADGIMSRLT